MYGQKIQPPPGVDPAHAMQGGEPREADFMLSPSSAVVGFEEMKIHRIGEGTESSFLHSLGSSLCYFSA